MFGSETRKKLERAEQTLAEVRAALKIPSDADIANYCWGLQITLETNANLLEGAANVIKSADEWFSTQKKAKKKKAVKKTDEV